MWRLHGAEGTFSLVDLTMRSPSHGCMNSPITTTLSGGPSSTLPLPLPLPLPPKPRPPPPLPLPVHSGSVPREGGGGGVPWPWVWAGHLDRPWTRASALARLAGLPG